MNLLEKMKSGLFLKITILVLAIIPSAAIDSIDRSVYPWGTVNFIGKEELLRLIQTPYLETYLESSDFLQYCEEHGIDVQKLKETLIFAQKAYRDPSVMQAKIEQIFAQKTAEFEQDGLGKLITFFDQLLLLPGEKKSIDAWIDQQQKLPDYPFPFIFVYYIGFFPAKRAELQCKFKEDEFKKLENLIYQATNRLRSLGYRSMSESIFCIVTAKSE